MEEDSGELTWADFYESMNLSVKVSCLETTCREPPLTKHCDLSLGTHMPLEEAYLAHMKHLQQLGGQTGCCCLSTCCSIAWHACAILWCRPHPAGYIQGSHQGWHCWAHISALACSCCVVVKSTMTYWAWKWTGWPSLCSGAQGYWSGPCPPNLGGHICSCCASLLVPANALYPSWQRLRAGHAVWNWWVNGIFEILGFRIEESFEIICVSYTATVSTTVPLWRWGIWRRCLDGFFLARCCLGKVPGGASFSQLHKGDGKIARTGHIMQIYNKNIKTN